MTDHNEFDAVIRAARYVPDPEPILRLAETIIGPRPWIDWDEDEPLIMPASMGASAILTPYVAVRLLVEPQAEDLV